MVRKGLVPLGHYQPVDYVDTLTSDFLYLEWGVWLRFIMGESLCARDVGVSTVPLVRVG